MNKICQHCNNQYEPINFRGSEQKFCSVNCRNEASKKRKTEELKNELRNELKNEARVYEPDNVNIGNSKPINTTAYHIPNRANQFANNQTQTDTNITNSFDGSILGYIERRYEAKTEALEYKLRLENALRENDALESELVELETKLSALPVAETKSEKVMMGLIESCMPLVPIFVEKLFGGDKKIS